MHAFCAYIQACDMHAFSANIQEAVQTYMQTKSIQTYIHAHTCIFTYMLTHMNTQIQHALVRKGVYYI